MRKTITLFTLLALLILALPLSTAAQAAVDCEFEYTVQQGDWLSKIADKYYGNVLAYDRTLTIAFTGGTLTFQSSQ